MSRCGGTLHLFSPDSRDQDPICSCASISAQGEGCSFLRTQDAQAGVCVGARSWGRGVSQNTPCPQDTAVRGACQMENKAHT